MAGFSRALHISGPLTAAGVALLAVATADAQPRRHHTHHAPPAATAPASTTPIYRDPHASIDARVNDLLARMSLEEKVAQMTTVWTNKTEMFDAHNEFDLAKAQQNFPNGIGEFARPNDWTGPESPVAHPHRNAHESVALVNAIQHWAMDNTRLGIPVMFHEEGLHGAVVPDATSFPQAIALASSWDPDLVLHVNQVTARELRVRGVYAVLSPVVDVARDPRWGRIEETFGEDPYLVGEMGVAAVRGLQGDSLPLADGHVFATLKHMTGHGQPESGTNVGPALISERTLREDFFPPFEQAVHRTNVRRVMASYNEIDGVPSHANYWLLHDILRGEWAYQGSVVSDYFAIEQLADIHHIAADHAGAALRALHAGVDVDLPDGASYRTLVDAVHAGRVNIADIDAAVRRVLTIKFEAGLFEHPYADGDAAEALTGNAEARALAEEAARRSVVLLKNTGNLLPLDVSGIHTLAVIGHDAEKAHLGGYANVPRQTISILDGIRTYVGNRAQVLYSEGVRITDSDDWWADSVQLADPAQNAQRIRDAVAVARRADHIVLVLGDTEQTSREGWAPNHLGDRDSLDLVGQQNDLFNAILALHKPTVVVLANGRPPSYPNVADNAPAILETWYEGQEGGTAIAQILFGDANPGGHLPVTVARSVGQLPVYYNYKPSAHRGYLFDTAAPLWPFGYGLSYTAFDISAPRLSAATIHAADSVQVSVDVRNTGTRAGDEVVQLYIHDQVSSVTRPVKELRGFQRVTLRPGQSQTVTFTLTPESLRFWNADMQRVVEPGAFDIMVGDNSQDVKTTVLTVQ
ncbi:MAG: glycoside hydrolase family 3 N-terminal domain-containing protein [Alphaproteobacteria bacterium]